MRGVLLPDHERGRVEPATPEQVRAILETPADLPALWHLYALLGLRRGEPLGLRWRDLDLA